MCFTPQKYRFDTSPSESAPEIQRDDSHKRNQRSFCFTHLTFGLLDGWWSYEDAELRIPGSPGLYPKSWERVLHSEGYRAVCFPVETAHDLGQQIIAAESDGLVRMQGIRDGRKPYAAPAEVFRKPAQPVSRSRAPEEHQAVKADGESVASHVRSVIKTSIADVLK